MSEANKLAIDVTLLVTSVLEMLDIPYFICGSLASSLYGNARTTNDSDIVADIRVEHVRGFVDALKSEFYVSYDAIIDALVYDTSFNLIHLASIFKVDVFIPKQRPFDRAQLERSQVVIHFDESHRSALYLSAEDTILSKLEWYRLGGESSEQQWTDIMLVLSVQGDSLDSDYLSGMAVELGVEDLLERAVASIS